MYRRYWRSILAIITFSAIPIYCATALSIEHAPIDLRIDSEPLGQALQDFAKQSGIQVIFFSKVTEGRQAPALRGRFTAESALHRLLEDSKLTYREINPNTIEIRPLAAVNSLTKTNESQVAADTSDASEVDTAEQPPGQFRLAQAGSATAPSATSIKKDVNDASSVEEITVTARRISENLQTAPVAVTAFSDVVLRQFAIQDATDLSGRAPNVQIMQTGAGSGAVSIFIRGTGNTALGFNIENPVGMYVDDVYLPRLQGSLIDLLGFERIEILRGPQGTLYGRDSTVGALKYVSRQPDLFDAHYNAEASFGDYDRRDTKLSVSVPLITGQLAVKLDAATTNQQGYMTGVDAAGQATGQYGNGLDRQSGRLAILWTPGEHWRISLEGDFATDKSGSTQATPLVSLSGGPCNSVVAPCRTLFPSPYDTGLNSTQFNNPYDRNSANESPGYDDTAGGSAHVEYDTDWGLIKSITAYRNLQELDAIDLSQVPNTDRILPDYKSQNQVSEELQVQSKSDGRLTWLGGLFFFHEYILHEANFLGIQLDDDRQTSNSYAAFADITYEILTGFHINLGGRITSEDRSINRVVLPAGSGPPIISGNASFSESQATYKAGLDYTIVPDVMAYITNSTGYRPGSFASTYAFPAVAPVVFGHTDAETAINTEIGLKSEWFEHRLRANVDVFRTDYRNAQTQATSFPYNVTATDFNYKGVELELEARPVSELSLYASLGTLSAQTLSGPASGMRPHFAPSVQYSLGAEYRVAIRDDFTFFVGVNDVHTSEFSTDPSNIPSVIQNGYSLVGAQVGLEFGDGKYRVSVDGKNITNTAYFYATSPNNVQFYGPPRTTFVTFSAHL